MPGIRAPKLIRELSQQANRAKLFYARLAEEYDGIGQYVLIDLSKGSVAAVYKARIAAGDFNSGRKFPVGTPVSVHISRGQLEILSLGGVNAVGDHTHPPNPQLCIPDTVGGTPTVTFENTAQSGSNLLLLPVTVGSGTDRALYGMVLHQATIPSTPNATWYPDYIDAGNPGAGQSMELIESLVHPSSATMLIAIFRLLAPNSSIQGTSSIVFGTGNNVGSQAVAWVLSGVSQSTPEIDTSVASGTGTGSSVVVTSAVNALVLDMASWAASTATVVAPTATAGQIVSGTKTIDNPPGGGDLASGAGRSIATTLTWDFGAAGSQNWLAATVAVRGSSVGTLNDGHPDLVQFTTRASRCGHHHHLLRTTDPTANDDINSGYPVTTQWYNSTNGKTYLLRDNTATAAVWTQIAASTASELPFTPTDSVIATDVQAAIDELASRVWKQPVRAATTAAGTLATSFENGDTIDGIVLATGDRILIKNQAAGAENGIYTINATGAPTRAIDMNASTEVLGAAALVTEGTTNADKVFICTTNAPITLGTTALVFVQIGGSAALIVQEDDVTVDAAAATLDFGHGLDVTSSPAGEANVAVDEAELTHNSLGGLTTGDPHTQYLLESLADAKGDLFGASAADTPARVAAGTAGQLLVSRAAATPGVSWETQYGNVNFIISGAGSAITTGIKGYIRFPYACTIVEVTLLADVSGSVVIDIWKDTYANYPPTVADTITASAKPTISSAIKSQDATLTGWTKAIAAGDILAFNVDSASTITSLTVEVKFSKD